MPAKTICPKCSGTGVAGYETTWPCPWCGGAGTVEPAAPTHSEPRPDDEGRQRIKVAWSALEQAYLDGAESREWIRRSTALWREIDRAITPHPAPQPVRDAAVFPVCGCGGEIATMREMAELPPSEDRWCICLDPAPLGATRSMTPEEVESQKQFRRSISRPLGATDEGKDWRPEDADNLRQLRIMCFDLKAQLVPFGASADGWESAIGTLARAIRRAALQAEAR